MNQITGPKMLFVQVTGVPSGSPMSGLMIVEALKTRGWDVHVVFGDRGDCVRLYEAIGCHVHVIPHGNWLYASRWWQQAWRWMVEWWVSFRIGLLIRKQDFDLVYVNTLTGVAAAIAARQAGIPCLWHLRELFDDVGGEMQIPPLGGRSLVRRMLTELAERIITNSEFVRMNLTGASANARLCVVPNAVADAFFSDARTQQECRRLFNVSPGLSLIGVPGTLRPVKGHAFFIDAARRVAARVPDAYFLITGDGPAGYRKSLMAAIKDTPLQERVRFLGTVHDMAAFYRACDVICIPSRSEPAGRVVIESMACGTAIVATDVGGIPEAIEHQRTGLLSPFGDIHALADSLVWLLRDPSLRTRLSAAARAKAEAEYRQTIYTERVLGIVDSVMRAKAAVVSRSGIPKDHG